MLGLVSFSVSRDHSNMHSPADHSVGDAVIRLRPVMLVSKGIICLLSARLRCIQVTVEYLVSRQVDQAI